MVHLAYRNLFQNKIRLLISVGGVALALLLILVLDAIFTGSEQQLTAYMEYAGADVFVSQEGVRNLHMASSWLPASVIDEVNTIRGVESVTPILYQGSMMVSSEDRHPVYVIGLPPDPVVGKPWNVVEGIAVPKTGEAVIDHRIAQGAGLSLGSTVEIFGEPFEVVGLAEGTVNLVNSIAFISAEDFQQLRGNMPVVSFILVKVQASQLPENVAAQIEATVDGVTAQTNLAFAQAERQVVKDMGADVITIMNLVGFFVGLAVLSLTVYTATLSRRAEYGVLKALGARNGHLYCTVLTQALLSVASGLGVGLVLTLLLSAVLPRLGTSLVLVVSGASLLKVTGVSLLIAGLSAILPIRQIAGLDPVVVFRGK